MLNSVNDFQLNRLQAIIKPSKTVYVSLPSVVVGGSDFCLTNSKDIGTVQHQYGPNDDQHSVAYQRGSVAFQGRTQAGFTKEEFDAHYTNKNADGETIDRTLNPYETSRGFATSFGSDTRARGRCSIAGGTSCEANEENAGAFGKHSVVETTDSFAFGYELYVNWNNQFAVGQYNKSNWNILFCVGNGYKNKETGEVRRRNAIEVCDNGRIYCYLTEAGKNTNWYGDILTREEVEEYLQDKVSKTDYATGDAAGIVRVRGDRGITINGPGVVQGLIELVPASDAELTSRAWYKPITSGVLDKAIVVGISTNTITLTEGEKTSALEWLGATEKFAPAKVDKIGKLVVWASNGETSHWETIMSVPNAQKQPGVIATYGSAGDGTAANEYSKGYLVSNNPINAYHVATKQYVDNKIAELLARIEALESK